MSKIKIEEEEMKVDNEETKTKVKNKEAEMKVDNEETVAEKELIKARIEIEKELEEINKRKEVIENRIMKHNISFLRDEFKTVSKSESTSLNKLKALETKYYEEKSKFDEATDEKTSIIKKMHEEYPDYHTRDISNLTKEELLLEEKILEAYRDYVYENMFKPHFNTPYDATQYPQQSIQQPMTPHQRQECLRRQLMDQNMQPGWFQQQQQPLYPQSTYSTSTHYRNSNGTQQNRDSYLDRSNIETIYREIIDQLELIQVYINKKSRKPRSSKGKQTSKK